MPWPPGVSGVGAEDFASIVAAGAFGGGFGSRETVAADATLRLGRDGRHWVMFFVPFPEGAQSRVAPALAAGPCGRARRRSSTCRSTSSCFPSSSASSRCIASGSCRTPLHMRAHWSRGGMCGSRRNGTQPHVSAGQPGAHNGTQDLHSRPRLVRCRALLDTSGAQTNVQPAVPNVTPHIGIMAIQRRRGAPHGALLRQCAACGKDTALGHLDRGLVVAVRRAR